MPLPQPLPFLPYQGETKACDQCNARKLRCDRQHPCGRCKERGTRCTLAKVHKRRGPPSRSLNSVNEQRRPSSNGRLHISLPNRNEGGSPTSSRNDPAAYLDHDLEQDNVFPLSASDEYCESPSDFPVVGDSRLGLDAAEIDYSGDTNVKVAVFPINQLNGNEMWGQNTELRNVYQWQFMPDMSDVPDVGQLSRPGLNYIDDYAGLGSPCLAMVGTTGKCWPEQVTEAFLLPLIDTYLTRLYPTAPIFKRSYLHQRMIAQDHRTCPQFAALLLALAAFILIQPILANERQSIQYRRNQAIQLMGEAVRLRNTPDFGQQPSLEAILTSYFLFGCYFGLAQDNAAWFRLQEAVTLANMMNLQDPESYSDLSIEEKHARLRTYWILSITERAWAVRRRGGIHLPRRSVLTGSLRDILGGDQLATRDRTDAAVVTGLKRMVDLYDLIDERLIHCWNGSCGVEKHGHCHILTREEAITFYKLQSPKPNFQANEALPESPLNLSNYNYPNQKSLSGNDDKLSETQEVDIQISREWLHHRMWQLCLVHRLLRVDDTMPELRPDHLIKISQRVLDICTDSAMSSMEVHGVGLPEKVYTIAVSLAMLITEPEIHNTEFLMRTQTQTAGLSAKYSSLTPFIHMYQPRIMETLNGFLAFLARFRGGRHPYLKPFVQLVNSILPDYTEGELDVII